MTQISATLRDYTLTIPHREITFPQYVTYLNDIEINEYIKGQGDLDDFMTRCGFTPLVVGVNWTYTIKQTVLVFDRLILSPVIGDTVKVIYSFMAAGETTATRDAGATVKMTNSKSKFKSINAEIFSGSYVSINYTKDLDPSNLLKDPLFHRLGQYGFNGTNIPQATQSHYIHPGTGPGITEGNGLNMVPAEMSADGKDPKTFLEGQGSKDWGPKDFINEYAAYCASRGMRPQIYENCIWGTKEEMIKFLTWFNVKRVYHGIETNLPDFQKKHWPNGGQSYADRQTANIPAYRAIRPDLISVLNIGPPWSPQKYQLDWNTAVKAAITANGWKGPNTAVRGYLHVDDNTNPWGVEWDGADYLVNLERMLVWIDEGMKGSIDYFYNVPEYRQCALNITQIAIGTYDDPTTPRYTYLENMFIVLSYQNLVTYNRDLYAGWIEQAVYDSAKKGIDTTDQNATTDVMFYALQQMGWIFPHGDTETSALNDVTQLDGCRSIGAVRKGGAKKYTVFSVMNTEPTPKQIDSFYHGKNLLSNGIVFTIFSADLTAKKNNFQIGRQGSYVDVPGYASVIVIFED